jgi:hypothetical protein
MGNDNELDSKIISTKILENVGLTPLFFSTEYLNCGSFLVLGRCSFLFSSSEGFTFQKKKTFGTDSID